VREIVVNVVSLPKRVKVLFAQVWFADSDLHRDYVVYHKAPANRNSKGGWWARSLADVAALGDFDLRQPAHAAQLEAVLTALPLPELEAVLTDSA
jgi:hypothetical protein